MDYITEQLRPLARPLEDLTLWDKKDNPNVGDIEALAGSLLAFGQRTPVVHGPEHLVKGNTTLLAAQLLQTGWRPEGSENITKLGEGEWTHLAVVDVEDDPVTAGAYAITDNRIRDLATTNEDALAEILTWIDEQSDLLIVTTYNADDIEALLDWAEAFEPFEAEAFAEQAVQAKQSDDAFAPFVPEPEDFEPLPDSTDDDPPDERSANVQATPQPPPIEPEPQPVKALVRFRFGEIKATVDSDTYNALLAKFSAQSEFGVKGAYLPMLELLGAPTESIRSDT